VHPTLTLLVMKFLPLHHYESTKKRKRNVIIRFWVLAHYGVHKKLSQFDNF
jgi:hypothetical protein